MGDKPSSLMGRKTLVQVARRLQDGIMKTKGGVYKKNGNATIETGSLLWHTRLG